MRLFQALYSIINNKCPRCHRGKVFTEKNPYLLTRIFHLHERCPHCQLKYEREPSFFYGAMYASYAITAGWFIIWYLLYITVFNQMDTLLFATLLGLSVLLLSPLTLRLSRLLWLNLFVKFDKNYLKEEQKLNTTEHVRNA